MTAYEIGIKASALDHLLLVTAAGFYYDYRNRQIRGEGNFPPFGALPELVNIPRSNVKGAELEVTLHPLRALRLTGGAT